jgi:hypothetical protein
MTMNTLSTLSPCLWVCLGPPSGVIGPRCRHTQTPEGGLKSLSVSNQRTDAIGGVLCAQVLGVGGVFSALACHQLARPGRPGGPASGTPWPTFARLAGLRAGCGLGPAPSLVHLPGNWARQGHPGAANSGRNGAGVCTGSLHEPVP